MDSEIRRQTFSSLSQHLRSRRKELLKRWRTAVLEDEKLTTGKSLPQYQLNDHVPSALQAFEQHLKSLASDTKIETAAKSEVIAAADAHGTHRWQQGFDLHEVVRELGHLNYIVVGEINDFARSNAADPESMKSAHLSWAAAYTAGIEQSTNQFFQLRQMESSGHVKDLEHALSEVRELDNQRTALWEQMAHDLRGNVGVVSAATRGIQTAHATQELKDKFTAILERNVESLTHLLDDVTSLARLQAGKEERQIASFDVSELLTSLCDGLQGLAHQRHLYLRAVSSGHPLTVEGDAVKVRRLAQNLIINALKYTVTGGVEVTWESNAGKEDKKRWRLTIRDTGPGIHSGPATPLASALRHATEVANEVKSSQSLPVSGEHATSTYHEALSSDDGRTPQAPGEGIGLSIVKRLASLLDATIEVESEVRIGTIFTILLPKQYCQ